MDQQQVLDDLLELLTAHQVEIRREPMGGTGGGLCQIKEKSVFFLDTQASQWDMTQSCAEAVHQLIDIETIYLRPQVRQVLEQHSRL